MAETTPPETPEDAPAPLAAPTSKIPNIPGLKNLPNMPNIPKIGKPRVPDMKGFSKGFSLGFGKLFDILAGETSIHAFETPPLSPHLPSDLVGGSVPYIAGAENDTVWHAASQACGTETIHYAYSIDGGRVWYLAVPSSSLASIANSWCPLASALPGQSEHWDKDTVYLYEQEGQASALRWDGDSNRMQLFVGPSRTILPRIQSMNANFVTINPETARPLPWQSRNLKLERMARYSSVVALLSGVVMAALLLFYILFVNVTTISLRPKLDELKMQSQKASQDLITKSYQAFASNTPKHFARSRELHQALFDVGGQLLKYQLKDDGSVEWSALVPQAVVAAENPAFRSSKPSAQISADGRVIITGTE